MSGFQPQISGVLSDRSANCGTTTAHLPAHFVQLTNGFYFLFSLPLCANYTKITNDPFCLYSFSVPSLCRKQSFSMKP